MIARPETLKRIQAQADEHADRAVTQLLESGSLNDMLATLRAAYLAGADAGYTARCAEESTS